MEVSILLISLYKITANQDKAINQNVIKTAANHSDIIFISDLLHPQDWVCFIFGVLPGLCFLQCKLFSNLVI